MRSLQFVFLLYCVCATQVIAGGEISSTDPRYSEIRDITLLPYYETLQQGEVAALGQYLSTKRFSVNRVLIEQNSAYPDHLRKHFKGAGFELLSLTEDGNNESVTALVRIYWPDGRETQAVLGLIEESFDNSDTSWKIDRD